MTNYTTIDWCEITWNPCPGCLRGCPYCYARKLALEGRLKGKRGYEYGFEPNLCPERLKNPVPKHDPQPSLVFVESMGELFGDWLLYHHIRRNWIEMVLKIVHETPQHCFLFLTKYPHNMHKAETFFGIEYPVNAWLGTTVTKESDQWRALALNFAKFQRRHVKFISFEPLHGPITLKPNDVNKINWFIIGAQTKPTKQPRKRWVVDLLKLAHKCNISVLIKKNVVLRGINPQDYQQYPHRSLWGDLKAFYPDPSIIDSPALRDTFY